MPPLWPKIFFVWHTKKIRKLGLAPPPLVASKNSAPLFEILNTRATGRLRLRRYTLHWFTVKKACKRSRRICVAGEAAWFPRSGKSRVWRNSTGKTSTMLYTYIMQPGKVNVLCVRVFRMTSRSNWPERDNLIEFIDFRWRCSRGHAADVFINWCFMVFGSHWRCSSA